jgi:hypothetical protein
MKTTKFYLIGLISIMIFTFSQQTFGQLTPIFGPGYQATINAALENSIVRNTLKNQNKRNSGDSKSKSSNQTSSTEEVPAYRRYPAVQFKSTGTRLTLPEFVESLGGTPQDKADTKKLVAGILDKYDAEARAKGYPNDLALALVSYIGLNGNVYNEKKEKLILPFEQNIGMRDMLAESASESGTFNALTDRQKQEIYEILVMTAGLTYYYYEKALRENNSKDLKTCKLVAAQNLKIVGIKL